MAEINYELIEKVRKFVEEECRKPGANYGVEAYTHHFVPTVKYARMLAKKLNADKEIVELSAWLHDIGSIMVGRENHHITGGEIAEKKLRELGYDEEKIKRIKECIFTHRGSKGIKPESKEAQILADADGMDTFDNLEGLFYAAFVTEKKNTKEGRDSVRQKIINSYNKLSDSAKDILKDKYEASVLLLGEKNAD